MGVFEDFVNANLPLRVVEYNPLNSGYDYDPNDVGAPAQIQNAPRGAFYYNTTGSLYVKQTPTSGSWTLVGSGGGGGGAGENSASYLVLSSTSSLVNERVFTVGPGLSSSDGGADGNFTVSAPFVSASFITISSEALLPNERAFVLGLGLSSSDGGANGNFTVSARDNILATISGAIFTGRVYASGGLTGSLQEVSPGVPYLQAGPGTTLVTQSNGSIIISGSVDNFSYKTVTSSSTVTIPEYQQMLYEGDLVIDGELVVNGDAVQNNDSMFSVALIVTGSKVDISASQPPSTGYTLVATNSTTAIWNPAPTKLIFSGTIYNGNPVSNSFTASNGELVRFDLISGSFSTSLKFSPEINDSIMFKHISSNTGSLTINGNGKTIDGASTFSIDSSKGFANFIYDGAEWLVVDSDTPFAHEAEMAAAGGAALVGVTPLTNITATDVQAALAQIDPTLTTLDKIRKGLTCAALAAPVSLTLAGAAYTFTGIAYGNSLYVVAGFSGAAHYSSDTFNWTAVVINATFSSYQLRYLGGVFIAVGDQAGTGTIYSSTLGSSSWSGSGATSTSCSAITDVTYGNNLYVAATIDGGVYTTADPTLTWNEVVAPAPAVEEFYAVAYGSGRFLAVGYSDASGEAWSATSTNGVTWSTTDILEASTNRLHSIAFGNGVFITGGENRTLLRSTNGTTWAALIAPALTSDTINDITYDDGLFIAITSSGSILVSDDDGITWQVVSTSAAGSCGRSAYINNHWMMVGPARNVRVAAPFYPARF